ncbi:MAG: hypothetical protein IMZ49_00410 [Actinobacteria bacterium]|nr:hypothetical protein [Actinomycetota bacterium]MBE3126979.1 hypothetical protein [Candidatus Atribacteria bacterium]
MKFTDITQILGPVPFGISAAYEYFTKQSTQQELQIKSLINVVPAGILVGGAALYPVLTGAGIAGGATAAKLGAGGASAALVGGSTLGAVAITTAGQVAKTGIVAGTTWSLLQDPKILLTIAAVAVAYLFLRSKK